MPIQCLYQVAETTAAGLARNGTIDLLTAVKLLIKADKEEAKNSGSKNSDESCRTVD